MTSASHCFGQRLRRLRRLRGLSQRRLAERARLSVNAIGLFERGERFPRSGSIDALSAALELPADELLAPLLPGAAAAEQHHAGPAVKSKARDELYLLLQRRSEREVESVIAVARALLEALDADGQ